MKQLILTTVLASGLILGGCVTASQKAAALDLRTAKQICDTFTQLSYDGKLDTQLTKDEIKVFNQKRNAFCK
jgi:hypothetical protein